jgi:methylthioribose-1-phosphate isomerase
MAGHFMKQGDVDCVHRPAQTGLHQTETLLTKSEPIQLPFLPKKMAFRFYVAAPISTLDLSLATGDEIPIEERRSEEVSQVGGVQMAQSAF